MRFLLVVLCVVLTFGCNAHPKSTSSEGESTSSAAVPGPSLYAMSMSLRDERGEPIRIDAFRGHPVIVSMFYTSCVSACPLLVSHVKQIESALPSAARDQTRVLLVSFDPEHDTPPVLASAATQRSLDLDRWTLATAPEGDVRVLAAALDITYRKLPEGGFSHTSVITVLDTEGRPIARVDDPSADLTPLVDAIESVAR